MKNHKKKNLLKLNKLFLLLLLCMPHLYCMDGKRNSYQQRNRTLTTFLKTYKQKKIDLNKPYGSEPPLIQSVVDDSMLNITQKLLDEGADVNITNAKGTSALAHAIDNKAYQTAHELLKRNVDVHNGIKDEWKRNIAPIHLLCRKENNAAGNPEELSLLNALLKAGASLSCTDEFGVTPWLASLWDYHRMKIFLDNNANPNASGRCHYSSNSNDTALLLLCELHFIHEREKKITLLLEYGADPNFGLPLKQLFNFYKPKQLEVNQSIAERLINGGAFIKAAINYKGANDPLATYIRRKYPPQKRIALILAHLFKKSATVGSQPLPLDILIVIGQKFAPPVQPAA